MHGRQININFRFLCRQICILYFRKIYYCKGICLINIASSSIFVLCLIILVTYRLFNLESPIKGILYAVSDAFEIYIFFIN